MAVLTRVTIEEAAAELPRLIAQVRQGEEVVIAQDGVEVARIVLPQSDPSGERKAKRQGGFLKGQIIEHDPDWWKPDDELADLFEGSESRFDELLSPPDGQR